jgi:hypothetical protein
MILHVVNYDKFIPPFIELINSKFNSDEHQFIVTAKQAGNFTETNKNVIYFKSGNVNSARNYIKLFFNLLRAEKIILHGLFNSRVILLLASAPWILKRCYWVIWGGDLYSYRKPKIKTKQRISEFLKSYVIRNVGFLVSYIPYDIKLAREWYNANGKHKNCLMYLSNTFERNTENKETHTSFFKEPLKILVGNSADPSNNHFEVFDKLKTYRAKCFKLIVPLSYGDMDYAEKVVRYGKSLFGDKFEAITEFMPIEKYREILSSIDLAIFNHNRQQAMGNTITLLGMGKAVYMRDNLSHYSFLSSIGIKLKTLDSLENDPITKHECDKNKSIIQEYFSEEKLIMQWEEIFRG